MKGGSEVSFWKRCIWTEGPKCGGGARHGKMHRKRVLAPETAKALRREVYLGDGGARRKEVRSARKTAGDSLGGRT